MPSQGHSSSVSCAHEEKIPACFDMKRQKKGRPAPAHKSFSLEFLSKRAAYYKHGPLMAQSICLLWSQSGNDTVRLLDLHPNSVVDIWTHQLYSLPALISH